MFATYHNDEKRVERRARQTYDLFKSIREAGCEVETVEAGGAPNEDQLIGWRDGSAENERLVKMQVNNFRVPEGHANIRLFITTRGLPYGMFGAIRESELHISDVYTHSQHVETEIAEGADGDDEVRVLDVTTQLILKFDEEI